MGCEAFYQRVLSDHRYLQVDPLGLYDGPNPYTYVHNNPVNYVDPTGLSWNCTYDQATGMISCQGDGDDAGKDFKKKCYSGNGDDKDNPDSQDKPNKGPIPRGDWDIGKSDSSKGPNTLDLNPQPGNDVYDTDRDPNSFRMHGDSKTDPGNASQGCIVCGQGVRQPLTSGGTIHVQ